MSVTTDLKRDITSWRRGPRVVVPQGYNNTPVKRILASFPPPPNIFARRNHCLEIFSRNTSLQHGPIFFFIQGGVIVTVKFQAEIGCGHINERGRYTELIEDKLRNNHEPFPWVDIQRIHISFETKYVRNEVSTEHMFRTTYSNRTIFVSYEGHSHFVRYEVRFCAVCVKIC